MATTGEEIRSKARELFEKTGLSVHESKDLEVGIFNHTIEYGSQNSIVLSWASEMFREAYLAKCRSVYVNLQKDSYVQNDRLFERLRDGEFKPHMIAAMSPSQVLPEKWKDIIDRELLRSKEAYEVTQVAMTDMVTCGKCKKNKVSYFELQIRSSDEPSTHFFTCLVCGNRWKH